MHYRCYFFGANGQLVGADTIVQDNESEARTAARRLFAQRAHATGYELRQGNRPIDAQSVKASGTPRAA